MKCDVADHGIYTQRFADFIAQAYKKQYKKEFQHELRPTVTTAYKRITLVAKEGSERLTIDYNLKLRVDGEDIILPPHFAILETKSLNGNGIADKILRSETERFAEGCSKFCLATILSGSVTRYNKFRPVIRKHFTLPAS